MKQIVQYKNGNHLSYTEYGNKDGSPILVQHGLIASIDDYYLFERLIQTGTRLITAARPGYGESTPYLMENFAEWADIMGVLIAELKLDRFDVLGMSSGAPYSYSIGYKFPEKVRNIFIFSGIPALYDEKVRLFWPYAVKRDASIAELEELAHELFFSHVSIEESRKNDIRDSMMNNCFGIAQDLRLRFLDWGFTLSDVKQSVYMEHSKDDLDIPFATAVLTSDLLPHCELKIREKGGHFSNQALDDFIKTVMLEHYQF